MAHVQINLSDNPAHTALSQAAAAMGVNFAALVARVAIWAPQSAHQERVTPENPTGAVYPHIRRARPGSGERAGTRVDGVLFDRNNYAGHAIRHAVGHPRSSLAGYQACHIWPSTCYNERYHTVLANLALIPASLVSLSDHEPTVIAALQYRAFALYGWHPVEHPAPQRPGGYPELWLAPTAPPERTAGVARSTLLRPSGPSGLRVPLAPPPRPAGAESQREVLQRLWTDLHADEPAVVRAWVAAEQAGVVARRSNLRQKPADDYARRLIYDGLKRGWLR